ncbi:P-loop containing nucleoside triphosphate hydrolase protein [Suillus subalutaceus]|uniref:P-loop containing nucleoside triphosphate hydrolase protein n=1 Tax=Suillus subalutaceus TaxID=48586 RepID=UPI001B860CD6|nr:P-loop containing nucleoside triphosphate hydrolase protein [Suillus subalutaceus]KAG1838807.1 P-loop containing nucleoside triphosphate hydrolase protein [Suillus subalutaceus]
MPTITMAGALLVLSRDLWLDYFHTKWSDWKVNRTVDAVLAERSLDPYSVMKRLKVANLPDLAASQVALAYPSLANALFGPDSFTEDGIAVKEPVRRFLDTLAAHLWAKYRKSIGRERGRLGKLRNKIDERWQEFSSLAEQNKSLLDAESIRTWLKDVDSLTKILTRYGDQESLKQLSNQQEMLKDLLQGLGIEVIGGSPCRLPKPLRQALSFLATEQDITLLAASIQDQLKHCDPDAMPADSIPELILMLPTTAPFNGLKIPFFNLLQDPYGNCDPWTESGQTWLKDPKNGEPLALRWHQLVGLIKMVKNAFSGSPVLLMDEVGLGKTIQVTALIALLAFYREFYAVHNCFPGKIVRSTSANIPNLPIILVIPANLVPQFTSELHRFLQYGAFDVLPYLATWRSRQSWWKDIWSRSMQPEGRRIIITTPKALESDCERIFEPSTLSPTTSPRQKVNYTMDAPTTAYGRDFLLGLVDEAHNYRNVRKGYWAIFCLRERCRAIVAMTATPITSRPLDIWNIGRCLGLEQFGSSYDDEALKMERQLRTAAAKDHNHGTVMGNADIEVPSLYRSQMLAWIDVIRKRFIGIVIRRTIWSVDYQGARISGLAPFEEHNLLVKLYSHEVENLELIAKDLVEEGGARAAKFASGSDFYMRVRRALLHPSCNPGYIWTNPSNLDEWAKDASRKLDVLAQVIRYHHEKDNRPPLRIADDKLVASSANPDVVEGIVDLTPCDKILVYCAFPSSYTQVMKVLALYGIQTLQIYGKLSMSTRTDIIAEFKNSGRDGARVLIISNVGLTGLNLPCANILIIVDSLWSATDEGQLIGRIYRPPQQKTVHIYRIVAADTQDVFLNNMAFSKAAILEAFTGATPRSLFNGEEEADGTDELSDIEDVPVKKAKADAKSPTAMPPKKRRGKAQGHKAVGVPSANKDAVFQKIVVPGLPTVEKPAPSLITDGKSRDVGAEAQVSIIVLEEDSLRKPESLPAPSLITDSNKSKALVITADGRSKEEFRPATSGGPTEVDSSTTSGGSTEVNSATTSGGPTEVDSSTTSGCSNKVNSATTSGGSTEANSFQGHPSSPIILPVKRPAETCYDDLEPKAQKSKTGDHASTLLSEMEQAGVAVDQFVTFLKFFQNSSSQNPDHPLAMFVPGLGLASGLSTPPPLNPSTSSKKINLGAPLGPGSYHKLGATQSTNEQMLLLI